MVDLVYDMADLVDRIEALLPAKGKQDILFRLFFGDRKRISKEEAFEFIDFCYAQEIHVTRIILSQIDKKRWVWTKRMNIRKRR